jgi:hypothetical protein
LQDNGLGGTLLPSLFTHDRAWKPVQIWERISVLFMITGDFLLLRSWSIAAVRGASSDVPVYWIFGFPTLELHHAQYKSVRNLAISSMRFPIA